MLFLDAKFKAKTACEQGLTAFKEQALPCLFYFQTLGGHRVGGALRQGLSPPCA
jgi:hypothetical protein